MSYTSSSLFCICLFLICAMVKAPMPLRASTVSNHGHIFGNRATSRPLRIAKQRTNVAIVDKTISVEKQEELKQQLTISEKNAAATVAEPVVKKVNGHAVKIAEKDMQVVEQPATGGGVQLQTATNGHVVQVVEKELEGPLQVIEPAQIVEQPSKVSEVEEEEEQNTLDRTLHKHLETFSTKGRMPAPYIAQIVHKMLNALAAYQIGKTAGKKPENGESSHRTEFNNLVTCRNFWVDARKSPELIIRFYGACQLGKVDDLAFRDVVQMSPEQLRDMRIQSSEKDIVWLLGSVIHLMIYQKYPLEEWEAQVLEGKFNLAKFASRQGCGQRYLADLQKAVTAVMETGQNFPISAKIPGKFYDDLVNVMEAALKTNPEDRISLDKFGQRMGEIVRGFNHQPCQWNF